VAKDQNVTAYPTFRVYKDSVQVRSHGAMVSLTYANTYALTFLVELAPRIWLRQVEQMLGWKGEASLKAMISMSLDKSK
jgi:hypothetical protein